MVVKDRYQGRPLTILLENLVLHSIGQLGDEQYAMLSNMEGRLQNLYHRQGNWQDILKAELRLPDNFEGRVKRMWERNRLIAQENGSVLDPTSFAQMFVDANFGPR